MRVKGASQTEETAGKRAEEREDGAYGHNEKKGNLLYHHRTSIRLGPIFYQMNTRVNQKKKRKGGGEKKYSLQKRGKTPRFISFLFF